MTEVNTYYTNEQYKQMEDVFKEKISDLGISKVFEESAHWLHHATKHFVEARAVMLSRKAYIDKVSASIYLELKERGEKMSENHLKSKVEVDDRFQKAREEYFVSVKEVEKINYLKELWTARNESAKNLLKLQTERNIHG